MYDAATKVVGAAPLATAVLKHAIVDRSRRYTSDRTRLSAPADQRGDLAARAAFFTIADAMKIAVPLGELAGRGALPARRPLRVLDIGAGCGAMSLGMIATLDPSIPLEITALDQSRDALAIARAAVAAFASARGTAVTYAARTQDVGTLPTSTFDLVMIGSVLNELPEADRLTIVEQSLAALADDGAVIVIEPALRDTSRALHAVRDAIIARGTGHVFAPCTRTVAPCPALADDRDWCHEDRPLQLPPRTAELARLTHLRDGGMKFSYLVVRKTALALVDAAGAWRVVSAPMPAKGRLELIGCGALGRVPLRLLRRHRAPGNRSFERADRGDVLIIDAIAGDDRVEITGETAVDRREPANS
ncbi:MAG: small ribosomal subunit Rsm22 family protein [Kofleriaceae bacterium]